MEWATGIEPATSGLEDRHSACWVSLTKINRIEELKSDNKSEIRNPKSEIELVHRERFELSQLEEATVLQTACLNQRRPMRKLKKINWWKLKFLCKNKKGREIDRLRTQLCPEQVNKIFFFGTRQSFYRRRKSFGNSLPFFVFVWKSRLSPHLRARKRETSKLFSVIQLSNIFEKRKGAVTFPVSFENFRVTAPKTIPDSTIR